MKYGDAQLALISRESHAARSDVACTLRRAARTAIDGARERPLLTAAAAAGGAVLVAGVVAPARRMRSAFGGLLRAGFGLMKFQGALSVLSTWPKDFTRHAAHRVQPPAESQKSARDAKRALRQATAQATE